MRELVRHIGDFGRRHDVEKQFAAIAIVGLNVAQQRNRGIRHGVGLTDRARAIFLEIAALHEFTVAPDQDAGGGDLAEQRIRDLIVEPN